MKRKLYFHPSAVLILLLMVLPYSVQAHDNVPAAPSLPAATTVTYVNTTPVWIPDGGDFDCDGSTPGAPAISTIVVPDDYTITDLDVQLSINHSRWVGDLVVWLTSPGGTTITLVNRPGQPTYSPCGFDSGNINTTLDDESANGSVHNGNPPTGPSYTPEQALSAFDGQTTQGTWTLTIIDASFGDNGALSSWGLNFTLPPNTRPAAHDDTDVVSPGGSILTLVIGNDTDPDSNIDYAGVTVLTPTTACGTAAFDGGGNVRYTNTNPSCTSDSYTYTVSDLAGATSNIATVTISINLPPTANPDSAAVMQGTFVDVNVVGNDTDPNGNANPNSITIVTTPVCGDAAVNGSGTVRYTNINTACTTDSFTYTLGDTLGAVSSAATVTITITLSPVPPVVPTEVTIPAPPPAQLLQDMAFTPDSAVSGWVPDALRTEVYAHLITVNRNYLWWYGSPLTNSGQIGIPTVLQAGVIQAVDIFSPSGLTTFEGGITVCLRGSGTMWYLPAAEAPRRAERLNTYDVAEFPGFTCVGLLAPGTVVLTDPVP